MRRILCIYIAVAVSVFVISCEKGNILVSEDAETVTMNYCVDVPSARSFAKGESVTHIWYAIYKDGSLLKDYGEVQFTAGSASCPVDMIVGNSYEIVFVGQTYFTSAGDLEGAYPIDPATATLRMPALAIANSDAYDLFYRKVSVVDYQGNEETSVTLERIVSVINFEASDWNAASVSQIPAESSVRLSDVPASFDLRTGSVSTQRTDVTFARAALNGEPASVASAFCIGADTEISAELSLYYSDPASTPKTISIADIPLQNNRRTTVLGAFVLGML